MDRHAVHRAFLAAARVVTWMCLLAAAEVSHCTTAALGRVELLPPGPRHIGDRLVLRVELTGPRRVRPQVALPHGDSDKIAWGTPVFEAVGESPDGLWESWELRCPVQVFVLGASELPSLEVGIGHDIFRTASLPVEIVSIRTGPDAELLRDIRPPVRIGRPTWHYMVGAAALAFAAAGALLTLHQVRRSHQSGPPAMNDAPQSPEEWLEEQFSRLAHVRVRDVSDLRDFVAQVADVVREYLALKTEIPAPRRTTRHTLGVAAKLLPARTLSHLDTLLSEADMAKFAAQVPADDAASAHLESARRVCTALSRELGAERGRNRAYGGHGDA